MMKESMKHELYYVTSNVGKFEEVAFYLKERAPELILRHVQFELDEIQSYDQQQIALHKAQQAWEHFKKPVLVDDSGIYFDKYHKFPGTMTKFLYAGIGMHGILKLVEPGDKAHYLLSLVFSDGPESFEVFEGRCDGHIVIPDRFIASPNLPFDDIFQPLGSDKSYIQMWGTPEMGAYFYRLRAFDAFLQWYKTTKLTKK